MTKIKIGECSVDSGQIMIIDPCYVLHQKDHETPTYEDLLDVYKTPKDLYVVTTAPKRFAPEIGNCLICGIG